MLVKQKLLGAFVGGLGLLAAAAPASAETIQFVLHSSSPTGVGIGEYQYKYDVILTGSSQVDSESLVTFYDFLGWTGVAGFEHNTDAALGLSASDFDLDTRFTGVTPAGASVSDDGTLINFTLRYLGDLLPDPPVGTITLLGVFTANSIYGDVGNIYTTVSKDLSADVATGTTLSDQITKTENVAGPVPQNYQGPVAVPLPSAVWGGMGLIGVVIGMRIRRTRAL